MIEPSEPIKDKTDMIIFIIVFVVVIILPVILYFTGFFNDSSTPNCHYYGDEYECTE